MLRELQGCSSVPVWLENVRMPPEQQEPGLPDSTRRLVLNKRRKGRLGTVPGLMDLLAPPYIVCWHCRP